jgi:hypothetical protein
VGANSASGFFATLLLAECCRQIPPIERAQPIYPVGTLFLGHITDFVVAIRTILRNPGGCRQLVIGSDLSEIRESDGIKELVASFQGVDWGMRERFWLWLRTSRFVRELYEEARAGDDHGAMHYPRRFCGTESSAQYFQN